MRSEFMRFKINSKTENKTKYVHGATMHLIETTPHADITLCTYMYENNSLHTLFYHGVIISMC